MGLDANELVAILVCVALIAVSIAIFANLRSSPKAHGAPPARSPPPTIAGIRNPAQSEAEKRFWESGESQLSDTPATPKSLQVQPPEPARPSRSPPPPPAISPPAGVPATQPPATTVSVGSAPQASLPKRPAPAPTVQMRGPSPAPTTLAMPAVVRPAVIHLRDARVPKPSPSRAPRHAPEPAPAVVGPAVFHSHDARVRKPTPAPARAPRPVPAPEPLPNYARNAGRRGFLYVARNNSHRPGVYKLGQTAFDDPEQRIAYLNDQLAQAGDLGEFHLVHAAAVPDADGYERLLFEALASRRVANGREYFFADGEVLRNAVDAMALHARDAGKAITDFCASSEWQDSPQRPTPVLPDCVVPPRLHEKAGWIYVLQNYWHEAGTALFSVTKRTESALLSEINAPQRTMTTQLGFYQVVACAPVESTTRASEAANRVFAPYRLSHRRKFVRAPHEVLVELAERVRIESSRADTSQQAAPVPGPGPNQLSLEGLEVRAVPPRSDGDIVVTALSGTPHRSFANWTAPCQGCGTRLRYSGAIGVRATVHCPVEGCSAEERVARIGAKGVEFSG